MLMNMDANAKSDSVKALHPIASVMTQAAAAGSEVRLLREMPYACFMAFSDWVPLPGAELAADNYESLSPYHNFTL